MSTAQHEDNAYGDPVAMPDGPYKGWLTWGLGRDPYETHLGPFLFRPAERCEDVLCVLDPKPHHMNGAQAIHGGTLMGFADFCLFAIAGPAMGDNTPSVTVTFNSEFLGPGDLSAPIYGRGRLLKATRSMVFVQGQLEQNETPILAFSGTLKKLRRPTG